MGEDGESPSGTVFLRVAVDDEVLTALPIDHHEAAVGLAEERIHGAGDAVLWKCDDLLGIVKGKPASHNLLFVELAEESELLELLLVWFPLQEVFDLLVHEGAALGGLEHLADDLLAAFSRFFHELLDVGLFIEKREELLDEGGHGGVVGGTRGVASIGVRVRGFAEYDVRMLRLRGGGVPRLDGRHQIPEIVGHPERLNVEVFLAKEVPFHGHRLPLCPPFLRFHDSVEFPVPSFQYGDNPPEEFHAGVGLFAHLTLGEPHHRPAAVVEVTVANLVFAFRIVHRESVPSMIRRVNLHVNADAVLLVHQCHRRLVWDGTAGYGQRHLTAEHGLQVATANGALEMHIGISVDIRAFT